MSEIDWRPTIARTFDFTIEENEADIHAQYPSLDDADMILGPAEPMEQSNNPSNEWTPTIGHTFDFSPEPTEEEIHASMNCEPWEDDETYTKQKT